MLVDVVRFADVTTTFGIETGDQVLVEIANRISRLFGDKATVGRVSGDVFGIVFPDVFTERRIQLEFHKLTEHFATPISCNNHAFIADFNVGVVVQRGHHKNINEFFSQAERALKQAKENQYENLFILDIGTEKHSSRSLALKADLKRALSNGELTLFLQPQHNLLTGDVIGAECLLRWNHPIDGVVFPGPLIEAAESYNMMHELGEWALKEAFHQLSKLNAMGIYIKLAINMSPTQLYDPNFAYMIKLLAQRSGVKLNDIVLELTEDVALNNSLVVKRQLDEINQLGVRVSIDDFGKGYSNLTYVRDVNLDILKIDKSFVMGLTDNPINAAIIEAAKLIGNAKGCEIVAEGIETLAQKSQLQKTGITMGQGFLFSPAIPFDEFVTYYNGIKQPNLTPVSDRMR